MNVDEALEYAKNALDRAFEDWLESERPSGDCESVHRQWDQSFAHQELVDELRPVMALTWEVRRLREENEHLRATQPQQSPWQPIATAPDDRPCIVGWVDLTNTDRYYFDIKQDGVWQDHDDSCEMAEACAPVGTVLPNRNPPYAYFIEIPPLQEPAP